eukprot:2236152-Amphidinium_carterae.1
MDNEQDMYKTTAKTVEFDSTNATHASNYKMAYLLSIELGNRCCREALDCPCLCLSLGVGCEQCSHLGALQVEVRCMEAH